MTEGMIDLRHVADIPQMVHMGYACTEVNRLAKNRYYASRGESVDRKRRWYVESRGAWLRWQPGEELSKGAKVVPYTGPIPEIFKSDEQDIGIL